MAVPQSCPKSPTPSRSGEFTVRASRAAVAAQSRPCGTGAAGSEPFNQTHSGIAFGFLWHAVCALPVGVWSSWSRKGARWLSRRRIPERCPRSRRGTGQEKEIAAPAEIGAGGSPSCVIPAGNALPGQIRVRPALRSAGSGDIPKAPLTEITPALPSPALDFGDVGNPKSQYTENPSFLPLHAP